MYTTALFRNSGKANEQRIPVHPLDFEHIAPELREHIYLEAGYGNSFGMSDAQLSRQFAGVLPREELFQQTRLWILPKPEEADFKWFTPNKVLWGWPHCVQRASITEAAILNRMTIVAWESMYDGTSRERVHVFHRNNELAGYAAVQHALMSTGVTAYFDTTLKAAVLGFGSTGRGAVSGLRSAGVPVIDVFTFRPTHLVSAASVGASFWQMERDGNDLYMSQHALGKWHSSELFNEYDIIVNCILQDPLNPVFIASVDQIQRSERANLIIDVSCDSELGFAFAGATTIEEPIRWIADTKVQYYAVDHTPSLYWRSASREISQALLPYLADMMSGRWNQNPVLAAATEIDNGEVKNEAILRFQNRHPVYPHAVR